MVAKFKSFKKNRTNLSFMICSSFFVMILVATIVNSSSVGGDSSIDVIGTWYYGAGWVIKDVR